jgi:hypothetical protein
LVNDHGLLAFVAFEPFGAVFAGGGWAESGFSLVGEVGVPAIGSGQ